MPQLVAAAVAYALPATAATALTVAGTAITYASLIGYAVTIGGAMAYGASQNAKMRNAMASLQNQGRDVMVRDPVAPQRAIYGQCMVSGPIVFMATSGTKNELLHLVIALAGHECDTLGAIYFDGSQTAVPLDGSGYGTGAYAGKLLVARHVGTAAQGYDTALSACVPSLWTVNHKLSGIAYLYVQMAYDTNLFPNGIPTIKCLVSGKKVFDPRDGTQSSGTPSTWKYSSNSALCAADYINDAKFGKGVAWARIDQTALTEAANTCDEAVSLAAGGTEHRYETHGTVDSSSTTDQILLQLVQAMAGSSVNTGGIWTVRAGSYRTPTVTLTDNDLVGAFSVQPRQSRRDTFNGVKGTFISPQNQWVASDFPPVKNDTYKAQDGGVRLWKDTQYPFTTSWTMVQRLAKIDLERGRQQITCSGIYKLSAFLVMPSDVVLITRAALGWSSKAFEVVEWSFTCDAKGALAVALTFRETASGVWTWSAEETTVDLAPNSSLPDPHVVGTPTGLTLLTDSTTSWTQTDGTFVPRLKLTWNTPNNTYVEQGGLTIIEFKKSADSTWIIWNTVRGDTLLDYLTDVKVGTNYDVRIVHQNAIGVRGAYQTVTGYTVAGDNSAPATPSGLTFVTGTGKSVSLSWNLNSEVDINEYVIQRSPDNATWAEIGRVAANRFVDVNVTIGSSYYYRIAATDFMANVSSYSSSVGAATPGTIGASVVDTTAPAAPSAPSVSSSGTRLSGDGTVLSYFVINMPAMPSGAVLFNLLYRKAGAAEWIIGNQTSTGGGTCNIDDLTPGTSYDFGIQAFSVFGYGSTITTLTSQAAPNTSTAPATPSGGSLSATGVLPKNNPSRSSYPLAYFGTLISWNANTEADFDHYEVKGTITDADGATDYSWSDIGGGTGGTRPTFDTAICFYNGSLNAGYIRVRAVNRSGLQSPWLRIGNANGTATLAVGQGASMNQGTTSNDMAAGNDSRITGAAQKASNLSDVANAATARQNLGVRDASHVQNLTGGATTETFTYTHNIGTQQYKVVIACVDPAGNVLAYHDYSNVGNDANNSVFLVADPSGGTISGGNRRFTIHFLP